MRGSWLGVGLVAAAVVAAACGSGDGGSPAPAAVTEPEAPAAPAPEPAAPEGPAPAAPASELPAPDPEPVEPDPPPDPREDPPDRQISDFLFLPLEATETADGTPIIREEVNPRRRPPWGTNWDVAIVDFDELTFLGGPRDGIKPLDSPAFTSIEEADLIYNPDSPVIHFERNGDVRAYPLDILVRHEIVNDVVGGVPVIVTFCPLCNTAIAFDARIDGRVLRMGTTGALRNSDLVMWDDVTESLWQQIGGEAIIGGYVGARLEILPAAIVSWDQFKASAPDGLVLSRDTGFALDYNVTPYAGYDSIARPPEHFRGVLDERLSPFERVVTVEFAAGPVAYPFTLLEQVRLVQQVRDGEAIVVFWTPGTQSAQDLYMIDDARRVGASGVFLATIDGQTLRFAANPDDEDTFLDEQTGSVWNVLGEAVEGSLAGARLEPIIHADHFWFAWAVFQPETEIVLEAG